jgi:hypothetical protein
MPDFELTPSKGKLGDWNFFLKPSKNQKLVTPTLYPYKIKYRALAARMPPCSNGKKWRKATPSPAVPGFRNEKI